MFEIEKIDGLYCVFKRERTGNRIICAHETLEKAKEAISKAYKEIKTST